MDALLTDAKKKRKPFDAVMVVDPSRWSRDNAKSKEGLKIFRDNGIRFFTLTQEHDLFNPTASLFLGMSAEMNEYQALTQKQKSMLNRIERAKRGIPTGGRLPFGRSFDKTANKWTIDPTKQTIAEEIAERFLAGEGLPKLAKEFGMNHSGLCKTLRGRCGTDWEISFVAPDLNINEVVKFKVPRLLPEKTIRQVRDRLKANRTHIRSGGIQKHDYLLSGRVFCSSCGYSLTGQARRSSGYRYYRHTYLDHIRDCSFDPKPNVRADALEAYVVRDLFNMFGNVTAIERAVKRAVPDCEKELAKRKRYETDLGKIEKARDRILGMIEKDAITDHDAEKKLLDLKDREVKVQTSIDRVDQVLTDLPDADTLKLFVERSEEDIFVMDDYGNKYAGGNDVQSFLMMTGRDRQDLIDSVFSGTQADGSPAGVYIKPKGGDPHGPKSFYYQLRGRLIGSVVRRILP